MSKGGTVALALGGVALVGGGAYLLLRKPVVTTAGTRAKPQVAAPAGSAVAALAAGGISAIMSFFGSGTKSAPTTSVINGQPIVAPDQAAQSAWNNTSEGDFADLAAGDAAMGIEGPF